MPEQMYIDPRYFVSVGYRNLPGYAIPKKATPHLTLLDDNIAPLCGAGKPGERSGHKRTEEWGKPICANCIEAAAQQELVEQPPLKLRPQDCPVLSERSGQRSKHIWVSHRPRCYACPRPEPYKNTERCERKHETFAQCNGCGAVDKAKHYCDVHVMSGFHSGPCDRRAVGDEPVLIPNRRNNHFSTYPDEWRYVCFQHHPDAVAKRRAEVEAKMQASSDRWNAARDREENERDAIDIAAEMARWIAANRELAAEDEWLGKIAERIASNSLVMEKMKGDGE